MRRAASTRARNTIPPKVVFHDVVRAGRLGGGRGPRVEDSLRQDARIRTGGTHRQWQQGRVLVLVLLVTLALAPAVMRGSAQAPVIQDASGAHAGSSGPAASVQGTPGPWGQLEFTRIVISPPAEYLTREWGPVHPFEWTFPAAKTGDVQAILTGAGMAGDVVRSLMAAARTDPRVSGIVLSPSAEVIRGLAPEVRASLYIRLARSEFNPAQNAAYRYAGSSVDEWLAGPAISASTRKLVDPLIYRHAGFMYFADLDLVRPLITDADELQRLVKRLLRQVTVVAKLRLRDLPRLNEVAEYWGRGGRRTDIRPLLESIAEGEGDASIDITHLLPTLARHLLYRYPKTTSADLAKPELANCFWTALNFFSEVPDDRFLDLAVSVDALKRNYYFVQDAFQLGDVVTFSNKDGQLFHVAVFIADNLLFTKNGSSVLSPWSLQSLEQLKGYYAAEFVDGARVSYLRRKDM